MLIPYNEIEQYRGDKLKPSLMEKKLYKLNTRIRGNLPSFSTKIEKDNLINNENENDNENESGDVYGSVSRSETKSEMFKTDLASNPTIDKWINDMKPHLSNSMLTSRKTYSLLNGIYKKFGDKKKIWNDDFNLIIENKVSNLISIIDLIKHLHAYQIKNTPIDVLDVYIKFLNTVGYPFTNVSSHAMKERMMQSLPSYLKPKKRKLNSVDNESADTAWVTLSSNQ